MKTGYYSQRVNICHNSAWNSEEIKMDFMRVLYSLLIQIDASFSTCVFIGNERFP